jgi:outer membrane protein assembly factor BamA
MFRINMWLPVLLLFASGCNLKKLVPDDRYRLVHNTIVLKGEYEDGSDMRAQVLHKPNRKILFGAVPFYLWLYKKGTSFRKPDKNETVGWRRKFRNDIGEAPVLLDTGLVELSAENLKKYLFNQGYFDNQVEWEWTGRKKKAAVTYNVQPGKLYRISAVQVDCVHDSIRAISIQALEKAGARNGQPLVFDEMDAWRAAISLAVRNEGYFSFNKEYVRFELDTFRNNAEANVKVFIQADAIRKRFIRKVWYELETSETYRGNKLHDTLMGDQGQTFFILNGYPLNTQSLSRISEFKSGELYRQDHHNNTYANLAATDLFRMIDISFGSVVPGPSSDSMDVVIRMKTAVRQSYSIEPQGIYSPQGSSGTNVNANNVSSYGLAGNFTFTNRNIFRNGEKLTTNLLGSLEAIISSEDNRRNILYGFQAGGNANLIISRPLLLEYLLPKADFRQVRTVFSLAYQYEGNPNFIRRTLPASLTYQWTKKQLNWYYTPLEISYNRNRLSPDFRLKLGSVDSLLVTRIFTDHLITAARLGFIYNSRGTASQGNYWYIRANLLETSGNLHRLIRRSLDEQRRPDTIYEAFGVRYFQYLRSEFDIRYNVKFDENNAAVFRTAFGLGLPYGNNTVLPFDRRFFTGGSNSLRAWRPRRVGPGSFVDSSGGLLFDRSGELLLQANAEYRFTLLRNFLEGALFLDAGNVWNLKHRGQLLPGVFEGSRFMSELAVNTGVGLRFDFSFFMIRFDWGIPLRDPSEKPENRWVIRQATNPGFIRDQTALTLGIGYPF